MRMLDLVAVLVVLAAGFNYCNHRYLRLPTTIGLMTQALALAFVVAIVGLFVPAVHDAAVAVVQAVDFRQTVLSGVLGFLLFAGALSINLNDLRNRQWIIAILATFGVLIATAVTGLGTYGVLTALGYPVRLIDCLVFGALIAPTDPVAVLAMLKRLQAPKDVEVKIAGESLFNDGVGVVVFLALLHMAEQEHVAFVWAELGWHFVRDALGGVLLGIGLGYVVYRLLKSVDDYQVEILLSLALVAGGYALAERVQVSAPIAIVVAGLLIGNHGRAFAMSETTRHHLDIFWELIDEILNAVLFVLIGLEVLVVAFAWSAFAAALLVIPVVLLARWLSVLIPIQALRGLGRRLPGALHAPFATHTVRILTWCGLRGAISVALALALPPSPHRELFILLTYVNVVFSIIVQGLTVGPLVQRWLRADGSVS